MHRSPFRARKGLSKPFARISIRNGFTGPTGDINVNSPLFTKRPSREENLTENLCDLPFFFRGPANSEAPSSSSMASDTGAPLTFPHCKQRSRLFEAIEPSTIKRPRKGKTSIRKFVFFGKFAKPRGATVRTTRIITELGMPVQDAFDAVLITNLRRLPSWVVLRGFDPCPYFLPYGVQWTLSYNSETPALGRG